LLAADELHPSGEMYGDWVKRILSVILQMLESN
jgi:hypothetical protein